VLSQKQEAKGFETKQLSKEELNEVRRIKKEGKRRDWSRRDSDCSVESHTDLGIKRGFLLGKKPTLGAVLSMLKRMQKK